MPTKTMLRAPELLAAARHSEGAIVGGTLDAQRIFAWRDQVAERDDSSQVEWLESQNAKLIRGDAVVSEPGVVTVDGAVEFRYDRLVIATGSAPVVPPIEGLDAVDYWTNIEATETLDVPGRLAVLGGGPVGCELAQFFQRVGSQVTLVQGDTRLLSRVDPEAAALVDEALRADGVDVRLGAQATKVSSGSLTLADGNDVSFDRLPGRHRAEAERRRTRRARPRDHAARNRGRRANARRRERVGARRRHRHRAVHTRRQVPRAHRRLRHGRS